MKDKRTTLIAWSKVCQPKKKEGLGILDIAIHNKALLMKTYISFSTKKTSLVSI